MLLKPHLLKPVHEKMNNYRSKSTDELLNILAKDGRKLDAFNKASIRNELRERGVAIDDPNDEPAHQSYDSRAALITFVVFIIIV